MQTTLILLILSLITTYDVTTDDNTLDYKTQYEIVIDMHEQLLNSWHQIYNDSAILHVANYFDSLDIIHNDLEIKWNKARSYHILGSINAANLDYNNAMNNYVISLKTLDNINSQYYDIKKHYLTGLIYKKISSLFLLSEHFNKSFDLLLKCINEFHECNDSSHLVVEYLTLGSFCDMLDKNGNNPDTNIYYIKTAENYLSKFPERSYEKAYYYYCLSYYYRSIHKQDSALILRNKALQNVPKYTSIYYSMNRAAAYAYYAEKEYDSALYYALEAFRSPDLFDQRDAAEGLAEIYKELGNEKESAKYASLHREIQRTYLDLKIQNSEISKTYDNYLTNKIKIESNKKSAQPICIFVIIVIAIVVTIKLNAIKNKASNCEEVTNTLFLEKWKALQETEIVLSIIERCNNNNDLMGDSIIYFKNPLTTTEISMYKTTIDSIFNDFTHKFTSKHSDMSSIELDYCFISILPLTEIQKAGLLSLSYQGIVSRRKRVTSKLKESLNNNKLIDFMQNSLKEGLI